MKAIILCMFLVFSFRCVAQTTWEGLHFGTDRKEVSNTLEKYNFSPLGNGRAGSVTVTPDFKLPTNSSVLSANLRPDIASAPVFFTPTLTFGTQDKLSSVKLTIDPKHTFQSTPALNSNLPLLAYLAGTSTYEQLQEKYGRPESIQGPCAEISLASLVGAITQCNAQWSVLGQTIDLFWAYSWPVQRLQFTITYSKPTSGL